MMTEKDSPPGDVIHEINISSSWCLENENNDLKNTISFSSSDKSVELEDVVQVDTCSRLIRNSGPTSSSATQAEPCSLTLSLPDSSSHLITKIVVVSEARHVELYGGCGEYLSTHTADYVDDYEGFAVYLARCTLKPSRQVVIKFQKIKHPDTLWLYGINLKLSENNASPSFSNINFQSVNEMLKDAKVPLSENAEKCKTFLQSYGGALDYAQSQRALSPHALLRILEAGYLNPISETGKNVSKRFSDWVPFMSKDGKAQNNRAESADGQNNCRQSNELLVLRNYIDQRFSALECKIDQFEQKIKDIEIRQNEKLDIIISLLNKTNI